jgi:hypothetical protein
MITDLDAADIWATWHASHGGFREVTLPANALDGIDPALVAQIPANISWYMDGVPEVTSVQPGWSRMQVVFIGRLAMYIVGAAGDTSFDPEAYAFVRWNGVKARFTDGYVVQNETTSWQTAGPGYSYCRAGGISGSVLAPTGPQPAWTASVTVTQTVAVGGVWTALHLERLSPSPNRFTTWGYPTFTSYSGGPFPVVVCYCAGVWEFSNDAGSPKTVIATWPGFTVS